ncbi:VOC family protein [Leifsonia sp. fls2-241-R2A-40a]|uniref:VOC family protein n=1 Tax=Leifsonia sp. fls2-241-R2A-40a TaxID=3040290 RepID=UPI0025503064|nr:VOC family protein [Leifsonia sp. fls2-241-R2A-40a]
MQKVSTFLWFESGVEEAATLYTSLIPNSSILEVKRFGEGMPNGLVVLRFTLDGVEYQAMNTGPAGGFTEAISLSVVCDDQAEVDRIWDALTADGGEESMCGWLKDPWGVNWQIVPRRLLELQADPDRDRADRANRAMLRMRKLDIAALEAAADGR